MREEILGIPFDCVTKDIAAERLLARLPHRENAVVCTPNPEIVWRSRKNELLRNALLRADMILPDGVGILWASKVCGGTITERVTGYDLFTLLLSRMTGTVYLLGGKPGVAEKAADVIRRSYPSVTVVGTADGYFAEDAPIVRDINEKSPDVLAVCLGSPKQELWMTERKKDLSVGVMLGLGGTLDVLSGDVKRAPDVWIDHNAEWLYRLLTQPFRLKRQLCLPLYAATVMAERIKHGKGKAHCP